MQRLIFVSLVCMLSGSLSAQVWDKPLAPGLMYRMETDLAGPRNIHALRWSPQLGKVQAIPSLGNGTIFSADVGKSRATVGAMVAQNQAIAGINADFFPWTGDPLGLMVKHDELISLPFPKRSFFAWGSKATRTGIGEFSGQVGWQEQSLKLNGVNQEMGPGEAVLFTSVSGFARSKEVATFWVLQPESGKLEPTGKFKAKVVQVLTDAKVREIAKPTWVLGASGRAAQAMGGIKIGDTVSFDIKTSGFEGASMDHAVAGGPNLLTNGTVAIDAESQGFGTSFSTTRHPRTAVGTTPEGDVWWVVVDGRQDLSVGASLDELAQILKRYGCDQGINLDGGGSSALHIAGIAVNRPSDGLEREVANGVVFVGPWSGSRSGDSLTLNLPEKLKVGEVLNLNAKLGGVALPQIEVLWSSMGGGWIDQGGQFKAVKPGVATIRAQARGIVVEGRIEIVAGDVPR